MWACVNITCLAGGSITSTGDSWAYRIATNSTVTSSIAAGRIGSYGSEIELSIVCIVTWWGCWRGSVRRRSMIVRWLSPNGMMCLRQPLETASNRQHTIPVPYILREDCGTCTISPKHASLTRGWSRCARQWWIGIQRTWKARFT